MDAAIDTVRVASTPDGPVPVVILTVDDDPDDQVLPIYIGFDEAVSITRGLDAKGIGRPLTHDLLLDVIEELGGRLDRVVITSIVDDTYIAHVHLETARGREAMVDARPSDALALASRTNAPIEVEESVFDEGREASEPFDELQDIREVVEFA